jgi:ligand-binding sensor domain-containing protein
MQDASGTVWAGTGLYDRGGAVRFQPEGESWSIARVLTAKDGLAGEKVRSIFQDGDGVMWFGSEYDGVARWDGTGWRVFTEADGLAAAEVKTMLQDADGSLWLGTVDGVTRISAEALQDMRGEP